ncbi:hypothetical protein RUM4293_03498 [Ruegeria atlantica]|uniref:Uncharacterized protein n=1 Tax=Ruegeria atlantica TaxID=81569 RepID=A0A0P1EPP6_9RHOB|nr:hypothetical protein RUM4293_03498 [Ruegeria atlantica]
MPAIKSGKMGLAAKAAGNGNFDDWQRCLMKQSPRMFEPQFSVECFWTCRQKRLEETFKLPH